MRRILLAGAFLLSAPAMAQTAPIPSFDDPRLQTIAPPPPGQSVRLVAFPDAPLSLVFAPGETVQRALISDSNAFAVAVVGRNDTLSIEPHQPGAMATLTVTTNRQNYTFDIETGSGLAAAYLVRIVAGPPAQPVQPASLAPPPPETMIGQYRLSGSNALRPTEIADDGNKTYVRWGRYQSIPAVFGVTPTGGEEVVDGHMREGVFTIDRVYPELVFRIDKEKVEAKRLEALASR